MKRPVLVRFRRTGFTLVEILVATTLALLLMGAVAVMFGRVAESITDSRSMLEAADRLRLAQTRLQMDLAGITATVCPPLKPENNEGYFEYIEGPALANSLIAINSDTGGNDQTVGDFDDILMFTTRTTGKPFVGRYGVGGVTIQSDVAEVAWFLRGRTLHRRVLLVAPNVTLPITTANYYTNYDISAYWDNINTRMVANTLGDLTRRECRFAHLNTFASSDWTWSITAFPLYTFPTLPTIYECSENGWLPSSTMYSPLPTLDLWTNTSGYRVPDDAYVTTAGGFRISDDVILTNVIGFDVKAWDPTASDGMGGLGAYVDLGHNFPSLPNGLGHNGQLPLQGSGITARVYDTWSTTYFGDYSHNGIDDDGNGNIDDDSEKNLDYWNNGLDDGGVVGIVDDDGEKINPPPYPIPLRGIQVKIRVFEPDSRQIREVTVVQEFLPR